MSTEENKAVFRRFIEAVWGGRDLDAIAGFYTPGLVDHVAMPGLPAGAAGVRARHEMLFAAFPDIALRIEDQVGEGDRVASRWTATGTHTGPLMGIAPSGKRATLTGIDVSRFEGGRVAEHWEQVDMLGLLQQLGAIPTPGQAPA